MISSKDLNKVQNEQIYLQSFYVVFTINKVNFIKLVPEGTLNSGCCHHMKFTTWERIGKFYHKVGTRRWDPGSTVYEPHQFRDF